jgi:bifunctional non-homologous end joining protein LigD
MKSPRPTGPRRAANVPEQAHRVTPKRASRAIAARTGDVVAGVTLSHPDKLLYPEAALTKLLLAQYYERVGERIVPHLRDRPLSLVRCPDGWNMQCFYQKHADKSVNAAVDRVTVPEGKSTATYMAAGSVTAVVALLQWGVLELHPWGSRVPRLDRPDRLIFDFDPDDKLGWEPLAEAARLTRRFLDDLGLQAFLKTTGGKGLHVVVPIRPTLDWDQAKSFTRSIADLLVRAFPARFTANLSKADRKNRIFIDYLRNAAGATAIAPYSLRARANAPVAMPIAWEELATDVRFDHFNVANVGKRLASTAKDPWRDFFSVRQAVTRATLKKVCSNER